MKALQDRLEKRRTKEIQKLSTLLQISQALAGTLDLRTALQDVLETLEPPPRRRPERRWSS